MMIVNTFQNKADMIGYEETVLLKGSAELSDEDFKNVEIRGS